MAQAMICDGCGEMPGILLITNLDSGDVLALCPPCSGIWAEAHHAEMARAFPERVNAPDGLDQGAESSENTVDIDTTPGGDEDGSLRAHDRGSEGSRARRTRKARADQPGGPGDEADRVGEGGNADDRTGRTVGSADDDAELSPVE